MRVLLAGGGSGGSVAPLLAVAGEIKKIQPNSRFLLVGTRKGPEKIMAENAEVDFVYITSGKLRRYFSFRNIFTPALIVVGFFQAFFILRKFKPNCVFGAGSFAQVPVIWAAWLLKIPAVIHQQDLVPSLANKFCQALAKKITVCFEKSLTDFEAGWGIFYKQKKFEKVILTGNPVRGGLGKINKSTAVKNLGLRVDMPVILVLGGGTGSDFINKMVQESLPELSKVIQIIHSLGSRVKKIIAFNNYYPFAFIKDMGDAYAAADIVLSRAGLSTLTELSSLGKVCIIIPMPNTHQEYNAALLNRLKSALVFEQKYVDPKKLIGVIKKILFDLPLQQALSKNISGIMPKNSAEKIAKIIINLTFDYKK